MLQKKKILKEIFTNDLTVINKKKLFPNKTQAYKVEIRSDKKNPHPNETPSRVQCYELSSYGHYAHECANKKKKQGKTIQVT